MFETTKQKNIVIKKCHPDELNLLCEMAGIDGRNPGLSDASVFLQLDPEGFFLALLDSEIVGAISGIKYGSEFGFIGMHMVHPEYRDTMLASSFLQAVMAHLGNRPLGVNCHESQMEFYGRFGFTAAHKIITFRGNTVRTEVLSGSIVSPFLHPFDYLTQIDNSCFPYGRLFFLQRWLNQAGSLLLAEKNSTGFDGYGLCRPCISGFEISNLLCSNPFTANKLIDSLTCHLEQGTEYNISIPEPNSDAIAVAVNRGMKVHAEHVRMYRNPAPQLKLQNIYSFSSVEVG